jgi:hypothetical protein
MNSLGAGRRSLRHCSQERSGGRLPAKREPPLVRERSSDADARCRKHICAILAMRSDWTSELSQTGDPCLSRYRRMSVPAPGKLEVDSKK